MSSPESTARSVVIDDVSKAFDATPVLSDVSLEVAAGEIVALLGPSGCGKTTLLRTLAGLERLDAGSIRVGDELVADASTFVTPEKRRIGMVFQDWALFPHLDVAANVGYGLPRAERKGPRVDEVLETVGLAGFGDRSPATLSGGQQQRVALARALAPRPSVLLLDEPFSNLDTALRVDLRAEVARLLVELRITAIFVTHDQEEAFVLGDRVAVMHEGRIEQVDRPPVLYTRPETRWVAGFIGKVNLLPAIGSGKSASTSVGDIALREPMTGPVEVVVRPEDVELTDGTDGHIELIEYYGHDAMVSVLLTDGTRVNVRTGPDLPQRRGDHCSLRYIGAATTAFAVSPAD